MITRSIKLLQNLLTGIVVALLFGPGGTRASDTEARLHCDKVTFAGPGDKIQISFTGLIEGQVEVTVRIGDKVIKVPKRFLFGAKDINVESIRIRVPQPGPKTPLWDQAATHGFWIFFDFGGTYEHGTKENPVTVYKTLLLQFDKDHLTGAELATPHDEFKNLWSFRYIEAATVDTAESVGKYGPENSVKCPWWRNDGQ